MNNYIHASIIGASIIAAGFLIRDGIANSSESITAYGDASLPGFFHAKGGKVRNCTTWPANQQEEPIVIGVTKGTNRYYLRCSDWDNGRVRIETKEGVTKDVPLDRELTEVFDSVDDDAAKAAKASGAGK